MEIDKTKQKSFQKITFMPNNMANDITKQNNSSNTEKKIISLIGTQRNVLPYLSKKTLSKKVRFVDKESTDNKLSKSVIFNEKEKGMKLDNTNQILFPSLKHKNMHLNNIKSFNNSSKSILSTSNKNSNNDKSIKNDSLFYNNKYIKLMRYNNNNSIESKTEKYNNNNFSRTNSMNKNWSNSSLKISKIKLNDLSLEKKPSKKLNVSLSCKNTTNTTFFGIKYSRFFKLSQKNRITARKIYHHYLEKSVGGGYFTEPIKNFEKFIRSKSQNFMEKLSRIYCENQKFSSMLREIKDNRRIAMKKDFDIREYQATLVELLEKRVSPKNLIDLQDGYRALNKKIEKVIEPRGRYTLLAEKLRYNLPSYLLEKFKQMDRDTIISRMNYYNQFKHFKKGNKLVCRFNNID